MTNQELLTLKQAVIDIAKVTGEFIQQQRANFHQVSLEEKGAHNLVTEVDQQAEARLFEALGNALPEAGFLGEEGNVKESSSGYQWIVDPIDGTSNFIHGLPLYSTSIALARDNQVVLGVVNDIAHQTVYHAVLNEGAYANAQTIHVSPTKTIYDSLFVTGFPYEERQLDQFLEIYKYLIRESRGVRRLGSAAIDLCYVAHGRFESFYEMGLNAWDIAAGGLIVTEAGGHVTTIEGSEDYLFGTSLLASNTHIHDAIAEVANRFLQS